MKWVLSFIIVLFGLGGGRSFASWGSKCFHWDYPVNNPLQCIGEKLVYDDEVSMNYLSCLGVGVVVADLIS